MSITAGLTLIAQIWQDEAAGAFRVLWNVIIYCILWLGFQTTYMNYESCIMYISYEVQLSVSYNCILLPALRVVSINLHTASCHLWEWLHMWVHFSCTPSMLHEWYPLPWHGPTEKDNDWKVIQKLRKLLNNWKIDI